MITTVITVVYRQLSETSPYCGYYPSPHFTNEKTDVKRFLSICPTHNQKEVELDFQPRWISKSSLWTLASMEHLHMLI